MRTSSFLIATIGLAAVAVLLFHSDSAAVFSAITALGSSGFTWVCLIHLASVAVCAAAIQMLADRPRPSLAGSLWVRLCRDAGSELLGIIPASGELLAIRMYHLFGMAAATASAVVIVDVTVELAAQLLFTLLGLALASAMLDRTLFDAALAGVAVLALAAVAFTVGQRRGMFKLLDGITQKLALGLSGQFSTIGRDTHSRLIALWSEPSRIALSFATHFAAWIVGVGEAWLALRLMGTHVAPETIIAIESLVFAARTAAFIVPGALGIQEGAYMALAATFGLPPEILLAVSLIKRGRAIGLGVPALVSWHMIEGYRARHPANSR